MKDHCNKVKDFSMAYGFGFRLGCGGDDDECGHDSKLCCFERKEAANKGLFAVWCGGYGINAKDIWDRKCDYWLNRFGRNTAESAGLLLYILDAMIENGPIAMNVALSVHQKVSYICKQFQPHLTAHS